MNKPNFAVGATPQTRSLYRDLLQRDFDEELLTETLSLARRVLETSGYRIVFHWESQRSSSRKRPYQIPNAATDYLKEFLERSNERLPVDMPEEVPDTTVLDRRAHEAAVLLTFQSRVTLQGDWTFFRDIQSLLFQACLHVLSPRLESRALLQANGFLLHALYEHAGHAWIDVPAHQYYLLSSFYEHLGNRSEALRFLRRSLDNSSPADHEFVTKAQTYWSLLVEDDRSEEAKDFVLATYRRADPKDLDEIKELVAETYGSEHPFRRAS